MGCVFCDINSPNSDISTLSHNRRILDVPSFYAVAARGQLCRGYSLICSKRHLHNMALHTDQQWEELSEVKNRFRSAASALYGCQPLFFEHGDACNGTRGGSCISHAHLHVVPLPLYSAPSMLIKHNAIHFSDEFTAHQYLRENSPYFYLELSNKEIYVLNSDFLPCQFGRQLVCYEFGLLSHWDWRKKLDSEQMIQTIEDYISYFNAHKNC